MKDPTVHFAVLGATLFAVWAMVGQEETTSNPERTIVVTQEQVEQLRRDYTLRTGKPPGIETLDGLVENRVMEEVLFREALALGLHQSDEIVRRRLIQVMGFLLEDLAPVQEPDEDTLRAWYKDRRDQYQRPARLSFDHVFFTEGDAGNPLARAEEALSRLTNDENEIENKDENGKEDGNENGKEGENRAPTWTSLGDPFISGRSFQKRNRAQVASLFGNDFAAALFSNETMNTWVGPLQSALGWHLVSIRAMEPGTSPPFEEVRQRVQDDWLEAQRDKANAAAKKSLRKRYTVERPDTESTPSESESP